MQILDTLATTIGPEAAIALVVVVAFIIVAFVAGLAMSSE